MLFFQKGTRNTNKTNINLFMIVFTYFKFTLHLLSQEDKRGQPVLQATACIVLRDAEGTIDRGLPWRTCADQTAKLL